MQTTGPSIAFARRRATSRFPRCRLSLEPANISAIANDVGTELIFLRQLIAQARPGRRGGRDFDQRRVAEHRMALEEARKRKIVDRGAIGL